MPERTLGDAVAALPGPLLVLAGPDVDTGWVPADARLETWPLTGGLGPRRGAATVVLAAPDREALERAVATLQRLPKVSTIAVWVADCDRPASPAPRANSPALTGVAASRIGSGWLTVATWETPVAVGGWAAQLARSLSGARRTPHDGLRLALAPTVDGLPGLGRPDLVDDPGAVSGEDVVVPPDVVLVPGSDLVPLGDHPILARPPVAVGVASSAYGLGPLDERVLNPRGFVRHGTAGTADRRVDGDRVRLDAPSGPHVSSLARGATGAMVSALRPVRDVRVDWAAGSALASTVAGLAMAGVPLTGPGEGPLDPRTADLLGGPLVTALGSSVDLGDPQAREEHSILLRRAALRTHAAAAWRPRMLEATGRPAPPPTTVSVLLATRRPDNLEFALRQVRRQRGASVELVLGTHGFAPDPAEVARLAGDLPVVVRPHGSEALFGDVLRDLAAAASGDLVLKMDDDDWYSPDFVADLLLARGYSGADLVGVPLEMVYLTPRHETLRRDYRTEVEVGVVAGGSMLLAPDLLREVGGWRPVRRWVDASLLADVRAVGGSIYRTHGLGSLFRRGEAGHTWTVGTDHFLSDEREVSVRPGFAPSRLLEPDPVDVPDGPRPSA